jgi:hypothetical protein
MSDLQPDPEEPELPAYVIEAARSGRAKCKACRKAIPKDTHRLGVLVEGPFGTGHMWYHVTCAARRLWPKLEEAYALEAWSLAKVPVDPADLPPLEELAKLREEAEKKKAEKKELPYVELSPSGRARCKLCDEPLEKGEPRVVLGREVEFGQQVRTAPINVHPACVADAVQAPDSATGPDGLVEALRANSGDLEAAALDAAIQAIGPLY